MTDFREPGTGEPETEAAPVVPPPPSLTIKAIKLAAVEYFDLAKGDMESASRVKKKAWPRQIAMYYARDITRRSLPEIGQKFGGRDHTTVIHAVRKVGGLLEKDPESLKPKDAKRRGQVVAFGQNLDRLRQGS